MAKPTDTIFMDGRSYQGEEAMDRLALAEEDEERDYRFFLKNGFWPDEF